MELHEETASRDDDDEPQHRHSLGHHRRPHLHISEHLHRRTNGDVVGGRDDGEEGKGAELLKVPETKTPRARSLDTTTGGGKTAESAADEGKEEVQANGYTSPSTPVERPRDATTGTTDVQPTKDTPDQKPRIDDVWDELRYERYEKPGVTPLYVPQYSSLIPSRT